MARRGGSLGGGGRSFGGGGSRGFGGRSGGGGISRGSFSGSSGRSSGSLGGRSGGTSRGSSGGLFGGGSTRSSGSFRTPPPPPMRPVFRPYGRPVVGGGRGTGCGCLTAPIIIILVFALIFGIIFIAALSSNTGDSGITRSTIKRQPLPKGSVVETGYYTDELGWIENQTKLTAGMKNFYKETGVQPYLYLTDNINGSQDPSEAEVEEFAFSLYDSLFRDEAHLLLIFFEPRPGEYSTWYVTGKQAKTVLDSEAMDILLDYIDRYYYYDDLTDEEFFSKSFNDAGKRIMTVYRSPWIPVLIILGLVLLILIGFIWWRRVKEQKNREAAETERILKTPLETFGDDAAEELAKKYQDDPDKKE